MNHIIEQISWLKNRIKLIYKEPEDSNTILYLNSIENFILRLQTDKISDQDLDSIISKYYIGYNCDKPDTDIENDFEFGFSIKEKEDLRMKVKNITTDIIRLLCSPPKHYTTFEFDEELLHS